MKHKRRAPVRATSRTSKATGSPQPPSIWPGPPGWVTSEPTRCAAEKKKEMKLPNTGERWIMKGIRLATGMGPSVRAPADGHVVFARGGKAAYRPTSPSAHHGSGPLKKKKTPPNRHLRGSNVKLGEKVKRCQFSWRRWATPAAATGPPPALRKLRVKRRLGNTPRSSISR